MCAVVIATKRLSDRDYGKHLVRGRGLARVSSCYHLACVGFRHKKRPEIDRPDSVVGVIQADAPRHRWFLQTS